MPRRQWCEIEMQVSNIAWCGAYRWRPRGETVPVQLNGVKEKNTSPLLQDQDRLMDMSITKSPDFFFSFLFFIQIEQKMIVYTVKWGCSEEMAGVGINKYRK